MKINTKKSLLVGALITIACMFAGMNVQASPNWSRFEILSMSSESPLNPSPGIIVSNLIIDNPGICGPLTGLGGYGNRPGHVEFEVANGYFAVLMADAGFPFQLGVKYLDPSFWGYPEDGKPSLYFIGLGRGYLALHDDSYFRFNELTLDEATGGIISCQLEVYQHGAGWDPFYKEGWEWVLLDYNRPPDATKKSLMSMVVVPEPTSAAFCVLAVGVIWFRCRNGTK